MVVEHLNYTTSCGMLLAWSGESGPVESQKGNLQMDRPFKILMTLIFVAALIPVGISIFLSADTSGWDATWVTLWDLAPLFAILAVVAIVAGFVIIRRGGFGAIVPIWMIPGVSEYTAEIAFAMGVAVIGIVAIRRMRRLARSDPERA